MKPITDQAVAPNPVRVPTGVAGLDEITLGGWPANHFYLLEGDPGAGKTTLALQFLLEGARVGERVLYVTLSESRLELEGVATSHSWELSEIEIFEFVPGEDSQDLDDHLLMLDRLRRHGGTIRTS